MFIPQVYAVALAMMIITMICWGSWTNTQKLTKNWRFELFYWDYIWGILLCALLLGVTMGNVDPASPDSFFRNLFAADAAHLTYAFLGGVVYNIANLLFIAALAIAGMAVTFPVAIGLALIIGSVLNYIITPKGNPLMLFGGVALVCAAIIVDAFAYRQLSPDAKVSKKGIILSLLSGVFMGLFYPLVAKGISGPHHLGPYSVAFVFALGTLALNIPGNLLLMHRPALGPPVKFSDYLAGPGRFHFWGIMGGMIWAVGSIFNFVASYANMVGPAASYSLGQGASMVGAIWGIFVWKEFAGAGPRTKQLLVLMFVFFLTGLFCVAMAPVTK